MSIIVDCQKNGECVKLLPMLQVKAEIIKNQELQPGTYYQLSLKTTGIVHLAKPGQFVHIKVSQGVIPLLRRPFSIHRVIRQNIEILYKVKGKGTETLSQRKRGEFLDLIGPLGNGYKLPDKGTKVVLVAGGVGVASLYFLAEELTRRSLPFTILIGGKKAEDILCGDIFKKLGGEIKISVEDGSLGRKGLVTDLLEREILQLTLQNDFVAFNSQPPTVIYACGPMKMLKEVAKIARRHRSSCQVSLEEHMACGVGACQGCVVRTKDSHKRVCKDGPIFNSEEIVW